MSEKRGEKELSVCADAQAMIVKARKEKVETVWDRLDDQTPHCKFCELGLSCHNCAMGPCRISPKGDKKQKGVCGAGPDTIVARNFGRGVAAGAAAHSDHGRDLVELLHALGEGATDGYEIRDEAKLRRIAEEVGCDVSGMSLKDAAKALGEKLMGQYGMVRGDLAFFSRVPEQRKALWKKLGVTPRGVDREVVEMMHRTHMGVDNDPVSLLLHSARISLSDGWGGSMMATEVSDIIFGTPKPVKALVNLGVLKKDHVNILVHGHNPVVSEMILAAVKNPELLALAKSKGAAGINLAGLCCTGNELLMRQGIPLAGNHLMTELAIVTGATDLMVVDYQCIMPAVVNVADCYHTRVVSTSDKAQFPGATHMEFHPHNAADEAVKVVRMAIEAYSERDASRVDIPVKPVDMYSGFSNEAILEALGGTPDPLIDAIKAGKVRGVIGIVGCNNPKVKHDHSHNTLARECIKRDILVLVTGCAAGAMGKDGLMVPEAASLCGPGLKEICGALGIPPVLHVGSCVDNSRILHICGLLAKTIGCDISDLPVAAAAPEWYSEKAETIGLYAVSSGIYTILGLPPMILGSELVTNLAVKGLEDVIGATFAVEGDPVKMADLAEARIVTKRKALGLE